jgi:xeroderma pigmentosum group C-complementing protein
MFKAGFNNHPVYALERQLKAGEILRIDAKEIGLYKSDPIYKREDVMMLKSREQWIKQGMQIKDGEDTPAKYVKSRANTIKKKREIQAFIDNDEEMSDENNPSKTGLFAEWQVKACVVAPLDTSKAIPRNKVILMFMLVWKL